MHWKETAKRGFLKYKKWVIQRG